MKKTHDIRAAKTNHIASVRIRLLAILVGKYVGARGLIRSEGRTKPCLRVVPRIFKHAHS